MMMNKIYIVDDDSDVCDALSGVFHSAGYSTEAFTDGRAFVRLARRQTPACVLLDICMPGPSGLDILKQLDARTYPAPILIVSGLDDVLSGSGHAKWGLRLYREAARLRRDRCAGRRCDGYVGQPSTARGAACILRLSVLGLP